MITERLILRACQVEDAPAALAVWRPCACCCSNGSPKPLAAALPAGRWAMERRRDGLVIGGAILLPYRQVTRTSRSAGNLHPDAWGHGYASETTYALANWAFRYDVNQIFAVVRPGNTRAAATTACTGSAKPASTSSSRCNSSGSARADLDQAAPNTQLPPTFGAN